MAILGKHEMVRPTAGASAAIFRGRDVLLIERGKGSLAGRWSLPGGHIEPGEKAADAALREVREETGIESKILGSIGVHDVILRGADGRLQAHYVLAVFYGVWTAGEPVASSDAAAARFFSRTEIEGLPMTEGALALIDLASRRLMTSDADR